MFFVFELLRIALILLYNKVMCLKITLCQRNGKRRKDFVSYKVLFSLRVTVTCVFVLS